MDELLEDEPRIGLANIRRVLGPGRHLRLVDKNSSMDAASAVGGACQFWGGGFDVLIPAERGRQPEGLWADYLLDSMPGVINTRGLVTSESGLPKVLGLSGSTSDNGVPLFSIYQPRIDPSDRGTVRVVQIPDDNPWFLAYLAALGTWPDEPDESIVRYSGYQQVTFDHLATTQRVVVERPSAEDLLARLKEIQVESPRRFSALGLSSFTVGKPPDFQGEPVFPDETRMLRRCGPNIVVVYEPDSIEDLCLLWNLRSVHGLPSGFPLGIPANDRASTSILAMVAGSAVTPWSLTSSDWALTSVSVSSDKLAEVAEELGPAASGVRSWTVVSPEELLSAMPAPGRTSTEVVSFHAGRALVRLWDSRDRDFIPIDGPGFFRPHLVARIELRERSLPPSRSLRARWVDEAVDQDPDTDVQLGREGIEFWTRDSEDVGEIRWPTGWRVLESLAADKGLVVQRTAQGEAAAAVLRRLASMADVTPLLSHSVLELLARLGQVSGRKFLERIEARIAALASSVEDGEKEAILALDRARALLARIASATDPESRPEARVGHLAQALGGEGAKRWFSWAEQKGLVVRGATVKCDRCYDVSWLALAALSSQLTCPSCGRRISRPYPADVLTFSYRASPVLLRAVATDAIPQLLAFRWAVQYFRGMGRGRSLLHGAYPGVVFGEEKGRSAGDADVILVFDDGSMVPGECKLRGGGLREENLAQLDALADALNAPWTFVATPSWASDCSSIWKESVVQLPSRPRFMLTGEHLLAPFVSRSVPLNHHPLPWAEFDEEQRAVGELAWRARVIQAINPSSGQLDLEHRRREMFEAWASGVHPDPWPRWPDLSVPME